MQPQIQYARTSDGVSIAYATSGDGPPILYCHDHTIAMQHHWTGSAPANGTIRTLSARAQVTIFDAAGIGASQRDVSDFSLEAQARAIEAVATHLAAAQFTLIGSGTATASAALYATQQPGRVRELVCVFPAFPIVRRTGAAIRDNWSLDRRRAAGALFPDGPVSGQRWYSNAMRESMTAEVYAAYRAEFADADLSAIYQRIPVPTLLCIAKEGRREKRRSRWRASCPPAALQRSPTSSEMTRWRRSSSSWAFKPRRTVRRLRRPVMPVGPPSSSSPTSSTRPPSRSAWAMKRFVHASRALDAATAFGDPRCIRARRSRARCSAMV